MVLGLGATGGGGGAASSPQDWFNSLPWCTRVWFSATMASTLFLTFGLITPLSIAYIPEFTYSGLQIWRIFTNFAFLGKFSFGFIMNILLLIQYSSKLEVEYQGRSSEYLWVLLLGMVSIITANHLFSLQMYFMSTTLVFYVLHIWCRRHPYANMSVFGLFNLSAAYLPFFLMLMTSLMGGNILDMLTGILLGHLFYYLNDVHPWTSGSSVFKPPQFLRQLVSDDSSVARPISGGGPVNTANTGRGSWTQQQQPPAAAQGNTGSSSFFRSTGHNWGSGRRLAEQSR